MRNRFVIRKNLNLYWHYILLNVKSAMEYKASFWMLSVGQFLLSFNILLGIWIMFQRFEDVAGYTYPQVILCFSIFLMEFTLAESFARGFDLFPGMVKTGNFDRIMLRPKNEILQILGSKFELNRCGRMLQALMMFFYGISQNVIIWNPLNTLTVLLMLIGGSVVFFGIYIVYGALCFFTLEGMEFMNIFTDGAREYGKYPIGVYGKNILTFCTFVVPYALVQYYPLMLIMGKSHNKWFALCPVLAMLFFIPCREMWKFGVKRYQSSGS